VETKNDNSRNKGEKEMMSMDDILLDEAHAHAELIIESAESNEEAIEDLFFNGYCHSIDEAEDMIFKHFFKNDTKEVKKSLCLKSI